MPKSGYPLTAVPSSGQASSDRIFVNKMTTTSRIFSYAVPSSSSGAYLRSWGQLPSGADGKSVAPLLSSAGARIFIQGQYLGKLDLQPTQPGGRFEFELGPPFFSLLSLLSSSSLSPLLTSLLTSPLLNVGKDKNIEVESNIIPPTLSNKEEKASAGWFMIEKKKYRVKTEDVGIVLRSTYTR